MIISPILICFVVVDDLLLKVKGTFTTSSACPYDVFPAQINCYDSIILVHRVCYGNPRSFRCNEANNRLHCRKDDSINEEIWKLCDRQQSCVIPKMEVGRFNCNNLCYQCVAVTSNVNVEDLKSLILSISDTPLVIGQINQTRQIITNHIARIEYEIKLLVSNISTSEVTEIRANGIQIKTKTLYTGTDASFHLQRTSVRLEVPSQMSNQIIAQASEMKLPDDVMMQLLPATRFVSTRQTTSLILNNSTYVSVLGFELTTNSGVNSLVNLSSKATNYQIIGSLHSMIKNRPSGGRIIYEEVAPRCSFVNLTEQTFSQVGCITSVHASDVQCTCNHTTLFAILLTVSSSTIPRSAQLVSYFMESISIMCLVITLTILIIVKKKINNDRIIIQINLSFALLFLHVFNIFHDVAILHPTSCQFIAVILHFFLLASGFWMLVEGINLYLKISNKSMEYVTNHRRGIYYINHLIGWLVPFLIVLLATFIGFPTNSYIDMNYVYSKYVTDDVTDDVARSIPKYDHCWLSVRSGMRTGAAVLPIAIIIFINIFFLIKTSYVVTKLKSNESKQIRNQDKLNKYTQVKNGVKAIITLLPVLGLPWLFAFLSDVGNNTTSTVFLYLNAIINGLQGLFILLIYCIRSKEVRETLQHIRRQYLAR